MFSFIACGIEDLFRNSLSTLRLCICSSVLSFWSVQYGWWDKQQSGSHKERRAAMEFRLHMLRGSTVGGRLWTKWAEYSEEGRQGGEGHNTGRLSSKEDTSVACLQTPISKQYQLRLHQQRGPGHSILQSISCEWKAVIGGVDPDLCLQRSLSPTGKGCGKQTTCIA